MFDSIDIVVKPDVSSALGFPATFPWCATLWRTANQSEQTSRPVRLLEGAVRRQADGCSLAGCWLSLIVI